VRDVLATLHAEITRQLHVAGAFAEPAEKE
jgi:hypothetical protein